MRVVISLLLLALVAFPGFAQLPDLDDLGRGLDLTPLATPASPPTPVPETLPPAADLHAGREILAADPRPAVEADPDTGLLRLRLPAGPRLIAPNPARLDSAWPLLRGAVSQASLEISGPFFVVLHADGKFSAAAPIRRDLPNPLPLGADISPQEELVLVGLWAELPEARRDHPAVLAAFQELRRQLRAAGIEPDAREFFFFPDEAGRVFFALRPGE